jgi:hypothetical protein
MACWIITATRAQAHACASTQTHARTHRHTENDYLLLFHGNSCFVNAPHCYVTCNCLHCCNYDAVCLLRGRTESLNKHSGKFWPLKWLTFTTILLSHFVKTTVSINLQLHAREYINIKLTLWRVSVICNFLIQTIQNVHIPINTHECIHL